MTNVDTASGKTHRDENFPVASVLIAPRHRGTILAFYRFARAADDVADHPTLPEPEKLALLDALEATLLGASEESADAVPLRRALAARSLSPRHAQDLLKAFRQDVTKHRYRDWDDLIDYCTYSAMPVGRFVLDVHGESRATWPASDALCAALQVINHLQDCAADYRRLDRVYIPLDGFERNGLTPQALAKPQASPELRHCLREMVERTSSLLQSSEVFSMQINDLRLAMEVAVIQRFARRLVAILRARDPLSERVHLGTGGAIAVASIAVAQAMGRRAARRFGAARQRAQDA
jgi:squalene synthase HpnC